MRVQHFEVRNRIDADHRVVTVAIARPVEPKWQIRNRATFILGSAAALWMAAWTAVHHLF